MAKGKIVNNPSSDTLQRQHMSSKQKEQVDLKERVVIEGASVNANEAPCVQD
jgi:hypothetical protein